MTESTNLPPSNFYALLIGIDYYLPNQLYKSLKGCVRDINLVFDYLQKTLKIPSEQIFKLTSPNPDSVEAVRVTDVTPTYQNIVEKFKLITELAQPKEQIYIHYSGHGGRAVTIYPELKGEGQNDEGIVPMDVGEDGYYLRDVELATLLKRMTDKELIVTVVLDSCHSGGATRGDCDIRGSESPDFAQRPEDSTVASRDELIENWRILTEGNGASSAWLPPSKDYVLLAACRPTEFAYEYAVNGKDRHGALTYWMIDTLTSTTTSDITYKSLHDRVTAKIQSKFTSQLPMLLGEAERVVFGRDRISTQYAVTVIQVDEKEKQITLNAGLAQGLSRGTRFAIYPLNTTDFSHKQLQLAIIEVTEVEASSSSAKVLEVNEGGIAIKGQIEQGAPAVMVSAPVDLVRRVRLFDPKQAGEKENELPPELVGKQKPALEAVRQALANNGWVVELQQNDNREAHYQVAVGRNGEYEICTGMPLKNLRPELTIDDPDAAKTIVNRLVHLAKYQTVSHYQYFL